MIMSIIRSSRNPRLPQLQPLSSARYNRINKKIKIKKTTKERTTVKLGVYRTVPYR